MSVAALKSDAILERLSKLHPNKIDLNLERAMDCARVDDAAGRQNALKPVREHLGRAVALGAGDEFKVVTEKKIELIMQTDSSKAVAKKGMPSQRLEQVKRS